MNKILAPFLLFFLITVIFGCTSTRIYQVQVNAYTDSAGALLAPGDSFFIIENPKAQNPLMEKEIKGKIENLLLKYGYILAPYDKAQFYLFFAFGLGTPQTVSVTGPIGPGRCYSELGYTAYLPPAYGPYCTDTFTLYGRWLRLTVVEGKYYRETVKSRTVWIGEVRSTGISSNLREVLDPLLIAAFEQFGKNTGKARTTIIKQNDPRVEELERALQGIAERLPAPANPKPQLGGRGKEAPS